MTVQILTYNGDLGMLTRSEIRFEFARSGTLVMKHSVRAASVDLYGSIEEAVIDKDTEDVGPSAGFVRVWLPRAADSGVKSNPPPPLYLP